MMKSKRLLLTLLMALLVPWAANAQSLFTEDFEDGTMPTGWTTDGSGTWSVATAVNSTHPSSAGEGTYCAQIKHGTTGAATKLITPEIDLSSVNSAELSFMHVEQSWSGDIDGLKIYYRTSSSGTWTQLKEYTAAYANWTTESGIVLPNPSSTYQIAFEYIDNYGYGLGIDYVDIVPGASCPAPTGLALTPNGQSATLTWVSNESSFNVAYSTDGTANPDDLTYTTVNTTSYTKDNLAVDTDHYFWVRANCSATEQSAWEGPVSVHIGYCMPAPTSVDNDGITNVTFGMGDYVVNNSTHPTSVPFFGDYTSQVGAVQAGVEANVAITYATGYTYMTYIWVDLDNSMSFDDDEILFSGNSSNSNPTTLNAAITIPATQALGDYRMRIGGADSGMDQGGNPCYSGYYGIFEDYTLRVLEAPSCLIPTGLTVTTDGATAIATWEGTATDYNISINGEVINNVTSPYEFRVELSTDYSVMVEANCPGETSGYCAPFNFTTPDCVGGHTIEYNLVDSYGDGWSGNAILVTDGCNTIATLTIEDGSSNSGSFTLCGDYYVFTWKTGSYPGEASFTITDNGITVASVSSGSSLTNGQVLYTIGDFAYAMPTDLNAEVTTTTATLTWTDNTAEAWQICFNGDEANLIDVTRTNYTVEGLTPSTEYTFKVRATGADGTSPWACPFTFTTQSLCPAPTDMAANDITANSAAISWTSESENFEMRYTLQYLDSDFEDGTLGTWTTIDADGDGNTWGIWPSDPTQYPNQGHNGSDYTATSASYAGTALTPDNYLVSPQITLGGIISFYACGQDASWAGEHFGVAVSTTGNTNAADFTTIVEWDMTAKGIGAPTKDTRSGNRDQGAWYLYTVDLSAYSGQGYVAIRHFNCTDMFRLNVDDIIIVEGDAEWTPVDDEIASPYTMTGLDTETTYVVQVRANCGDNGYSAWASTVFTTLPLCETPTEIAVEATTNSAVLTWTSEANSFDIELDGEVIAEDVTETTYTINDLDPGTIYAVRVLAHCDAGDSEWSAQKQFMTDCEAFDLPYEYDFNDLLTSDNPEYYCWTPSSWNTENSIGLYYEDDTQSGIMIGFGSTYPIQEGESYQQILISPELNTEAAVTVQFDYRPNRYDEENHVESFMVGYLTSLDEFDLEVIDFVEATNPSEMTTYTTTVPAGAKYVAVIYTGENPYTTNGGYYSYLFVDNFVFTEATVAGQTLNLGAGYNWVSLSVEVEDPIEMLDQVKAALGDKGITIEGNGVGTENFGDGEWFGDLDYEGMYNEQMYLIQVSEDCTVELAGTPIVDPTLHVIDIYPGYNWIGFPYSEELDVNEALMGFEALDEDMIESPEGISYYFGEWMGDVMTLVPGQGYLYFSNSEDVKTMTIQTAGKSGRLVKLAKKPVKSAMVEKVTPVEAKSKL